MRFNLLWAFACLVAPLHGALAAEPRDVTTNFVLHPPARVTVFAEAPLVSKPEAVGVDSQGRVWVLDAGKAFRLIDADGDGSAERAEPLDPAPPAARPVVDSFGNSWTLDPKAADPTLPLLITPPATATNRPSTGLAVYEAELKGWDGLFWGLLTADPGHRMVRNVRPTNETAIARSVAFPFILARTNTDFRPVDLAVGGAGELYVADATGRILRLTPPDWTNRYTPPDLGTTNGLLAALKSPAPAIWQSAIDGATRLGSNGSIALVMHFSSNSSAAYRARTIQAESQFGLRGRGFLKRCLQLHDPNLRLVALRMAHERYTNWFELAGRMRYGEPATTVRHEYERYLKDIPADESVPILVRLLNYTTSWGPLPDLERDAVLYAAQGKETRLADALSQTNAARYTDLMKLLQAKASAPHP